MTKWYASWFAMACTSLVLCGCATTLVVAPTAVARQGRASLDVEVLDRRADPAESASLASALRQALSQAAPRPGKLLIEVRDYQARFIRQPGSTQDYVVHVLLAGLVLGPYFAANKPVWYGVCHLGATYQSVDGAELGRWSIKGEKAAWNLWGYGTAREVFQGAFDEAIDRLIDHMALAGR